MDDEKDDVDDHDEDAAWLERLRFARARVELDPDDPDGHLELGWILFVHGRYEGAVDAFQRVLKIEPGDANARFYLAVIADEWGKPAQAAQEFSRLVARFPDADAAWDGLQRTTGRLIRRAHARFAFAGGFAAIAPITATTVGSSGFASVFVLILLGIATIAILVLWLRTRKHLGVRKLRSLVGMAVRQDRFIAISLVADAIALAALLGVVVAPTVAVKPLGLIALLAILFATAMHAFKPRDPVPEVES